MRAGLVHELTTGFYVEPSRMLLSEWLVDHWLHPIREVCHDHKHELATLPDERARWDRLVELNVIRQVKNVAQDVFVQDAWDRGQPLSVHGWVYSIATGDIWAYDAKRETFVSLDKLAA